ncbi:MAG: T9SS type A sorting domain-containing protein [Bacteroidales bacterium]|nr:T9SS type A sorting domain-containing protein [Bacteroidales bacterium]
MRTSLTAILMAVCLSVSSFGQMNRIEYNGQELFLNGTNLAWVDFARDIGPGETDFEKFGEVFKEMHDYGINSVRLWLHTNSWATPEFAGDTVKGPGEGAIEDLRQILDSAYAYDVGILLSLWSHDMLRLEIGEPYLTENRALLEDEHVLQTYIDHALIPMVDSTKDHPGIIAWEIFNEPEGMIEGVPDGGWGSHGHVTREQILRAVNRMAGAIHGVDINLKVTNGTHTLSSNSNRGLANFYTDDSLFNAGGDPLGYLDFYQVHFYDFALNPFNQPFSYWNLDKPLIIGEFHPDCNSCGDFSNYQTLFDNGYAGAFGWMWTDEYGDLIKEEAQHTFLNNTAEVDIDNMLGDTPYLVFSGPEYGAELESGSNVDFAADAEDTDGTVDSVEIILDREFVEDTVLATFSSAPYDFTWLAPDDGVYKVYARATDNDGYIKSTDPIAFTVGEPPLYRYEAEEAELSGGATIGNNASASGGQYVNYTSSPASILWTVLECPADGTYDMVIGYSTPNGEKNNYIIVNGDTDGQQDIHFPASSAWERDTIQVDLVAGTNTIEVGYFWGWMLFDYIEFPFPRPPKVKDIIITTETGNFSIDEKGGTLQMIGTVVPDNAVVKTVRWTVNNPAVGSIDENTGLLTAVSDGTVRVFAWATDNSGTTANVDVTISNQADALPEGYSLTHRVYPNPANSELYLTNTGDLRTVSVFNLQGQLLKTEPCEGGLNVLAVDELEPGIYYLSLIKQDGSAENLRFVKK